MERHDRSSSGWFAKFLKEINKPEISLVEAKDISQFEVLFLCCRVSHPVIDAKVRLSPVSMNTSLLTSGLWEALCWWRFSSLTELQSLILGSGGGGWLSEGILTRLVLMRQTQLTGPEPDGEWLSASGFTFTANFLSAISVGWDLITFSFASLYFSLITCWLDTFIDTDTCASELLLADGSSSPTAGGTVRSKIHKNWKCCGFKPVNYHFLKWMFP